MYINCLYAIAESYSDAVIQIIAIIWDDWIHQWKD